MPYCRRDAALFRQPMIYVIEYSKEADKTLRKWKKSNPQLFKKATKILMDIMLHPRTGLGHPRSACRRKRRDLFTPHHSPRPHHIRHLRRPHHGACSSSRGTLQRQVIFTAPLFTSNKQSNPTKQPHTHAPLPPHTPHSRHRPDPDSERSPIEWQANQGRCLCKERQKGRD